MTCIATAGLRKAGHGDHAYHVDIFYQLGDTVVIFWSVIGFICPVVVLCHHYLKRSTDNLQLRGATRQQELVLNPREARRDGREIDNRKDHGLHQRPVQGRGRVYEAEAGAIFYTLALVLKDILVTPYRSCNFGRRRPNYYITRLVQLDKEAG
jgi:hypothetical protein